jgi:hypothetical protein
MKGNIMTQAQFDEYQARLFKHLYLDLKAEHEALLNKHRQLEDQLKLAKKTASFSITRLKKQMNDMVLDSVI